MRYKFIKKAILKRKVFRAFLKQPAESHTLSSRGRAFQIKRLCLQKLYFPKQRLIQGLYGYNRSIFTVFILLCIKCILYKFIHYILYSVRPLCYRKDRRLHTVNDLINTRGVFKILSLRGGVYSRNLF